MGDAKADDAPVLAAPEPPDQLPTDASPEEEGAPAMLPHVHPPHHAAGNWQDFLLNVVTIVTGLIIAVALEQSVEFLHHREQRAQIEDEMREVFKDNRNLIADDLNQLNAFRTYLVDQQTALGQVQSGKAPDHAPAANDPRITGFLAIPGIGPYEAAKANGSVALLNIDRIRIYNRIELQYGLLRHDVDQHFEVLAQLRTLRKRFDSAAEFNKGIDLKESAALSSADLQEYRTLIGAALDSTDRVMVRLKRLDAQSTAVLNGASTEGELIDAAARIRKDAP